MSVGGPTVVIRLRNAGWWQTMMTLSAAAGGSYRSRARAGNKILVFWQILEYFDEWLCFSFLFIAWLCETSLRMEIKIKLPWLFVTWTIFKRHVGTYRWKKRPVKCSHGSGREEEWYTGNNVYQDLVGNNWDIMRSVTSV